MSDEIKQSGSQRLQRSELAVPATSEKFFAKAATGSADAIFLDLEDAVAPARKSQARDAAVQALRDIDWGNKTMAVRVNDLETPWAYRDIVDMVAHAPRLDLILLPKTACAADVLFLDRLITMVERETRRERRVGIEVLIETAMGVAHVEEIAAASPRLEAMIFGVGDYSVDMHTNDRVFGRVNPDYAMDNVEVESGEGPARAHVNDQWHFALARIANACRAYGLRPIDGPFTDYGDAAAYRASAMRSRALGFEGKWAIHPSQIDIANSVYSPAADQVAWAQRIVEALDSSNKEGRGAVGVDNVLVDMAHYKVASRIIARAGVIASKAQAGGAGV